MSVRIAKQIRPPDKNGGDGTKNTLAPAQAATPRKERAPRGRNWRLLCWVRQTIAR